MYDKTKYFDNIGDIFVDYLLYDLRNPAVQESILIHCYNFLIDKIRTEDDYLLFNVDMKFDKKGDCLTLKGNNLITSLWLIGVYPKNPSELKDRLTYNHQNIDYIYNPKNKKLTIVNK
jgi:hypothetical protein